MADLNVTSTLMLKGCATHPVLDADRLVAKAADTRPPTHHHPKRDGDSRM